MNITAEVVMTWTWAVTIPAIATSASIVTKSATWNAAGPAGRAYRSDVARLEIFEEPILREIDPTRSEVRRAVPFGHYGERADFVTGPIQHDPKACW